MDGGANPSGFEARAAYRSEIKRMSAVEAGESFEADVLVIGGGLSGTWAAVAAAREGASVILADKGYCGTSG